MTEESHTPVTHDLMALVNAELPDKKKDPLGRQIVKITMLLFVITVLGALLTVTYALAASINREHTLSSQLGCLRESSINYDKRVGEGINVVVSNQNVILNALGGVAKNDINIVKGALAEAPNIVQDGKQAQNNLTSAIVDRQASLDKCKSP